MEIMFADVVSMDAISWRFFKANHVSVSGDKAKNVIQNFGVPAELITVNGSPRYDSFFDISTDELKKKSARLRNDNVKVMALFASTLSLNAYDKFVDPTILSSVKKTIFQAADQVEKINLVVKPHPLEDVSALKHLATGYRNITFVGAEEDIRELTKICDVFITLGSMSTLGALILRKPVIWPAFSGSIWWEEEDPFIMSGATLVARSMEELVNYLLCLIDGKGDMLLNDIESSRQLFLENWLYRPDGQASYRIASLARRMAAKKIVVDSG
jgi:CDP-glycerol glycerophosphotransferase (TagB/SpsB family)